MKEPERLLQGGATEFERTLLQSVQHERPSPELTARMERALGIALASGFSAAAATEASAATQTTVAQGSGGALGSQPLAGNVISGNVVSGNVIGGNVVSGNVATTNAVAGKAIAGKLVAGKVGAHAVSGLALKAGIGAVLGTGLAVSAVTLVPRTPSSVPEPGRAESTSVAAPGERARAEAEGDLEAIDAPTLREEIGLLDQARAALARGDTASARSALERYRQSFPRGALLREARVLWARAGAGPWRANTAESSAEGVPRH